MSACCIGGYIWDDNTQGDWLKMHTEKWERDICAIRKTANKYPQESYSAVDRVVQSEWIFLQCVTKETVEAFTGLGNLYGKPFCLVFSLEIEILPPNYRSSKYISGEEIWNGLTESCDVSTGEMHYLGTCKW